MFYETNTDVKYFGFSGVSPDSRIELDYFYKMTLEFICFSELHEFFGGKIEVPAGATHYRCNKRKIKFYKVNPSSPDNIRRIPEGAERVRFFGYSDFGKHVSYGEPSFYDKMGNVLNGASVN